MRLADRPVAIVRPPWISGYYYSSSNSYNGMPCATASQLNAGNQIIATAIWVPTNTSIARIACWPVAGGADGTKIKMGIYTDVAGYPGTLVSGSGSSEKTLAAGVLSEHTYASPVILPGPALYWTALISDSNTTYINGSSWSEFMGSMGITALTATPAQNQAWRVANTYTNGLPATFPGSATATGTGIPMVWLKVS